MMAENILILVFRNSGTKYKYKMLVFVIILNNYLRSFVDKQGIYEMGPK